jgi:hypothetical protein
MPGVKRERDDSVGVLTLDEPETLNAMTPDLLGDLATAIGEINDDPRVAMQLEIRMPYGMPYQVRKVATIPLIRLSQIQVGAVVQVMVDMSDPTNPDKIGLLLK